MRDAVVVRQAVVDTLEKRLAGPDVALRGAVHRRAQRQSVRRPRRAGTAIASAEEVADAVLWLASPGAGAINGQAIPVAGGEVMAG